MANLLNVETNGVAMGMLSSASESAKKFESNWPTTFTDNIKIFGDINGLTNSTTWLTETRHNHGTEEVTPVKYGKCGCQCFIRGSIKVCNSTNSIALFRVPDAMIPSVPVRWISNYTSINGGIAQLTIGTNGWLYLDWVCAVNQIVVYSSAANDASSRITIELDVDYCVNNTDTIALPTVNTADYSLFNSEIRSITWTVNSGCNGNTSSSPYYTSYGYGSLQDYRITIGKAASSSSYNHGTYCVSAPITVPQDATYLRAYFNKSVSTELKVDIGLLSTDTSGKSNAYLVGTNNSSLSGVFAYEVGIDVSAYRGQTCRAVMNASTSNSNSSNANVIYIKKIWFEP